MAMRVPIPVVGIAEVAFDAMQPGMHPGAVGIVLRLRQFVRGMPIASQPMPYSAQHGRRKRRWPGLLGLITNTSNALGVVELMGLLLPEAHTVA